MNKAREFDQSVVAELKTLLGERVSTSHAVREHHGKDESYFPYALPDVVVFAHSTEEVRDIVNASADFAQNDPEPDASELYTDIYR